GGGGRARRGVGGRRRTAAGSFNSGGSLRAALHGTPAPGPHAGPARKGSPPMHRVNMGLLGGLLASLVLGLACGPGAPPAPAGSAGAAAPPAPARGNGGAGPAAAGGPASRAAFRQQGVDAARAGGPVEAGPQGTLAPEPVR